ncbi:hypothetical protein ACMBCN_02640 [Candidatus Liberibacter asiaticus]|nr:hypothetical protein [Candidatus Liberibacter asiaticus]
MTIRIVACLIEYESKLIWANSPVRITRKKWAGLDWVRASPIVRTQIFIFIFIN